MNKKARLSLIAGSVLLVLLLSIFVIADINDNWIIDGDKVYFEDANIYVSATPHTLKSSGWVIFNFTSKVYSGDVDAVLGFNTQIHQPQKIERYNPTIETRQMNYTCETDYFNYTLSPNYAWCYENLSYINNGTGVLDSHLEVIFEHSFDSGNIPSKTIYWDENYLDEWKSLALTFDSINYDYGGMNKWYYTQNININSGQEYVFRVYIKNLQPSFYQDREKYWFAIKPSSETISEAVSNSHLYALDPWTSGLDDGLIAYWNCSSKFESLHIDESITNPFNITLGGGDPTFDTGTYKLGGSSCYYDGNDFDKILENNQVALNHSGEDATFCYWYREPSASGSVGGFGKANVWWIYASGGGTFQLAGFSGSNAVGTTPREANAWRFLCGVKNSTHASIWVNGTVENIQARSSIADNNNDLEIGRSTGDTYVNGYFDGIAIWNRSLSDSEISDLYNSGTGLSRDGYSPDASAPDINITSPQNNTQSSDNTLDILYTRSDDVAISSCWYSNDTRTINTTLASCGNITSIIWSEGEHNVTIWVNDTSDKLNWSSVNFSIDAIPTITVLSPYKDTNYTTNTIYFNASSSEVIDTWIINWNGTNYTLPSINSSVNVEDGTFNLIFYGNDSTGNWGINNTINFTVDSTSPSISITIPEGHIYGKLETESYINIIATYSVTELYPGTLKYLVWAPNGTAIVKNETGDANYSTFDIPIILDSYGGYRINVYANDSHGNYENRTISFSLNIVGGASAVGGSIITKTDEEVESNVEEKVDSFMLSSENIFKKYFWVIIPLLVFLFAVIKRKPRKK